MVAAQTRRCLSLRRELLDHCVDLILLASGVLMHRAPKAKAGRLYDGDRPPLASIFRPLRTEMHISYC